MQNTILAKVVYRLVKPWQGVDLTADLKAYPNNRRAAA